jgi:hypothetical protein
MAERARTIGGEFIVRSAPSDGTLIEVLAPLAVSPPPDAGRDAIGPVLRGHGRRGPGMGGSGAIGPGQP